MCVENEKGREGKGREEKRNMMKYVSTYSFLTIYCSIWHVERPKETERKRRIDRKMELDRDKKKVDEIEMHRERERVK